MAAGYLSTYTSVRKLVVKDKQLYMPGCLTSGVVTVRMVESHIFGSRLIQ